MASRDKADVDTFHKCIQYALEKLGKSKSGFERTVISKFKSKRRVGSGNELVDYSRAPCLGADQKARGLWERDWTERETQPSTSHASIPRKMFYRPGPCRQTLHKRRRLRSNRNLILSNLMKVGHACEKEKY